MLLWVCVFVRERCDCFYSCSALCISWSKLSGRKVLIYIVMLSCKPILAVYGLHQLHQAVRIPDLCSFAEIRFWSLLVILHCFDAVVHPAYKQWSYCKYFSFGGPDLIQLLWQLKAGVDETEAKNHEVMKNARRKRKHCALAVVRWSQTFSSRHRPPSRGHGTAKI